MHRLSATPAEDSEGEYRAIEAALSETARGRWFLAEHGRRARRLDSALLDDAIVRLQASLRQPPALLGQLKAEIEDVKAMLAETRAALFAKPAAASAMTGEIAAAPQTILKAAEDIHDIAWALQANPFDPKGCEEIARNASRLYVASQAQAWESGRVQATAQSLDTAAGRIEAILETVMHELQIDQSARA